MRNAEIADRVGCSERHVRTILAANRPGTPTGGPPPPPAELDHVKDTTEVDGCVEVTKLDRLLSPDELAALAGLDPALWVCAHYTPNTWQGFYRLPTGGHQKVQLFQSKATFRRLIAPDLRDGILEWARQNVAPLSAPELPAMDHRTRDQLAVWGLWDAHLGMYAWGDEVGASFDLDIARRRVLNSIDDVSLELSLYPLAEVVMPVGNDYMHFDSCRMTTAHGEHRLDVDTRYGKVYGVALDCLARMVDRALQLAPKVTVIYVPGNHDYTSSFTLCAALQQRYLNDPRVSVDLGPSPRKYVRRRGVIVGFDHGADCRPDQLARIMAHECAEHWSASTYREIQVGHTHQKRATQYPATTPLNGILVRTQPALCNTDAWHHSKGFVGNEPAVEATRYDAATFRGSHAAPARDD